MCPTNDWRQWSRDGIGDPYLIWHDGPDFANLVRVARTEPATVHRMLAAGLQHGDDVVPPALVALSEHGLAPDDAEDLLRAAAATASDSFLASVAQALYWLTGDESWAAPIASVMATAKHWGIRLDAAIALRDFTRASELIEALARVMCDSD